MVVRTGSLVALALALSCARQEARPGLGRRVADGAVHSLRVSPDGAHLAFLQNCRTVKDRTLPAGTGSCGLVVVPVGGGAPRRVADGVTTLPHGFGWSASGHTLAALADYDHLEGRGALVSWRGGDPRRLAEGVGFYAVDRSGGRLAWVAGGQLYLARADGAAPSPVAGAEGVATFEFGGKEAVELLARRSGQAGGQLLAVRGLAAAPLAADVREYGFARDGRRFAFTSGAAQALAVGEGGRPSSPLGRGVSAFLFSPSGEAIAFVAGAAPGRQGDLWLARLGAGSPVRIAQRVGEPRWSADGARLGWLQDYDPRSRTGTLAVGGPEVKPVALARNVSDFDLVPDGSSAAYLVHETAGGYSVDLGLAQVKDGAEPLKVSKGVFGFSFSPDGRWLYYRTACIREAEACDLLRVPASPSQASSGKPELVVQGVKSFEFAPGRPDRLLVSWARKDRVALDVAWWEGGKLTAVDTYAVPGSVQFLGGDASRIAYAVVEPKRAGVYVAELP